MVQGIVIFLLFVLKFQKHFLSEIPFLQLLLHGISVSCSTGLYKTTDKGPCRLLTTRCEKGKWLSVQNFIPSYISCFSFIWVCDTRLLSANFTAVASLCSCMYDFNKLIWSVPVKRLGIIFWSRDFMPCFASRFAFQWNWPHQNEFDSAGVFGVWVCSFVPRSRLPWHRGKLAPTVQF